MKNKQYFFLVLPLFLFSACEPETKKEEVSEAKLQVEQEINKIDVHDLEILEIDNCEYIFYKKTSGTNKGFGFMAHKGNCKNPIHFYSISKKDH